MQYAVPVCLMDSTSETHSLRVQSAKAALAAALENAEGVREAVAAKEVLEAAQKSSTAAWRSHSVSPCPSIILLYHYAMFAHCDNPFMVTVGSAHCLRRAHACWSSSNDPTPWHDAVQAPY